MNATLYCGDCIETMATLPKNSIDSCVTDPPYGLGFMGKHWDHGVPGLPYWEAIYRVLKPGGHLLAFGGTRTYHRMACAIEDAGFEIRDCIQWLYGSGFPKSHDVSKGIDRAAGAERKVVGVYRSPENTSGRSDGSGVECMAGKGIGGLNPITTSTTDAARQWEGWGTALKPANEPIVLARKPLSEATVAANVLKWGTGAINVDGCRVAGTKPQVTQGVNGNATSFNVAKERRVSGPPTEGRWPANVIHDGSEEVLAGFPETNSGGQNHVTRAGAVGRNFNLKQIDTVSYLNETGSAARFFYCAKANKKERAGSKHPTVKPIKLLRYLVRLITPPGGIVLDPFAGTGTTGEAAIREGMQAVLIEREVEYQQDIRRRLEDGCSDQLTLKI